MRIISLAFFCFLIGCGVKSTDNKINSLNNESTTAAPEIKDLQSNNSEGEKPFCQDMAFGESPGENCVIRYCEDMLFGQSPGVNCEEKQKPWYQKIFSEEENQKNQEG